MIQEAHPLKQGLKLQFFIPLAFFAWYSRGASIKTRIETLDKGIDTLPIHAIQEAHPLKQGLKQPCRVRIIHEGLIQEAHPLKQGLKQKTETEEVK